MQGKKNSNAQISNRKPSSTRISGQQAQQGQPNNNGNNANAIKQRDDAIFLIVRQYLQKSGYQRTFQTFKNEKPVKRILPNVVSGKQIFNGYGTNEEKNIVNLFEKGNKDQFFKQTDKMFSTVLSTANEEIAQALRRLEFELNIYFCIYSIHPCTSPGNRKTQVDRSAAQAFKKYIDAKGPQVSQQSQLLAFFALPYIPKPQQNPSMAKVFTKQWVQKLKSNLIDNLREYSSRSTANSNKENKKSSNLTTLHEIYDRYLESSVNQSRLKDEEQKQIDPKIVEKYQREIQELRVHNKEMVNYLDIMQQNVKDLNEASKTNLVESNRKWFQFSKEILQLTKKACRGENVKQKLETYERFFGTNIDDLIYCTEDISLFEKNSYTQDHSSLPQKHHNIDRSSNNNVIQMTPIDISKITSLFAKADRADMEMEICIVLKALKDRLCSHRSAYTRREVVVSYQRNDLCALKESNYPIQKKLLLDSSEKVKEFYLRLMNYISTDDLGNQYLSGSERLIENLMGIMGSTTEDVPYRKHAIGILQKLSYIKQSQMIMMSFGIIPMIFKMFRNEGDSLHETTVQYLMGLIMNLAVRKQSISNFQKHKSEALPILLRFIDRQDNQVKGYVNGTLYVLLQLESIKREAIQKYNIKQKLKQLLARSQNRLQHIDPDQSEGQNCVIRQYTYILERLEEPTSTSLDPDYVDDQDDEDDQQCVEDIDDIEMFSDNQSNSSQYIEGEENMLSGEELLMKKYALLGPQAVREEIINRSILDETGRKSNNMTTSIHHSKRMDKVFQKSDRPETPSLLPMSLDLSITPNR